MFHAISQRQSRYAKMLSFFFIDISISSSLESQETVTIKWQNVRELKRHALKFNMLQVWLQSRVNAIDIQIKTKSAGETITLTSEMTLDVNEEPPTGSKTYKPVKDVERNVIKY